MTKPIRKTREDNSELRSLQRAAKTTGTNDAEESPDADKDRAQPH
jgi:hypothetical protein